MYLVFEIEPNDHNFKPSYKFLYTIDEPNIHKINSAMISNFCGWSFETPDNCNCIDGHEFKFELEHYGLYILTFIGPQKSKLIVNTNFKHTDNPKLLQLIRDYKLKLCI